MLSLLRTQTHTHTHALPFTLTRIVSFPFVVFANASVRERVRCEKVLCSLPFPVLSRFLSHDPTLVWMGNKTRERQRQRVWERERQRQREKETERVCVCVRKRERERDSVCVWKRERDEFLCVLWVCHDETSSLVNCQFSVNARKFLWI